MRESEIFDTDVSKCQQVCINVLITCQVYCDRIGLTIYVSDAPFLSLVPTFDDSCAQHS